MRTERFLADCTKPAGARTTLAVWGERSGRLRGVATRNAGASAVKLLAYGLEHLGERTLELALPPRAAKVTRYRAALLDADVRVYEDRGGAITPTEPATPRDAIVWLGKLGKVRKPKDVEAFPTGPAWLRELVDWVESRRVERVRRSYWAWHYRGRQVLKAQVTRKGVTLTAGVNYSKPTTDQPKSFIKSWSHDEEPSDTDLRMVREAVDLAIERRRVGDDDRHREHLLQGALGTDPALLGLTHLYREFPAWRPAVKKASSGYIDFLGVDLHGGLHVVETKIGPDPMLGLQALDYWAWITANRREIADIFDTASPEIETPVQMHVVLGCSRKGLIHSAAAETLRCIPPDRTPWQCHLIEDWDTTGDATLLRTRAVPRIPSGHVPTEHRCAALQA